MATGSPGLRDRLVREGPSRPARARRAGPRPPGRPLGARTLHRQGARPRQGRRARGRPRAAGRADRSGPHLARPGGGRGPFAEAFAAEPTLDVAVTDLPRSLGPWTRSSADERVSRLLYLPVLARRRGRLRARRRSGSARRRHGDGRPGTTAQPPDPPGRDLVRRVAPRLGHRRGAGPDRADRADLARIQRPLGRPARSGRVPRRVSHRDPPDPAALAALGLADHPRRAGPRGPRRLGRHARPGASTRRRRPVPAGLRLQGASSLAHLGRRAIARQPPRPTSA